MTAEICVMNRYAAVLAADSATTVTRWTSTGREERYFKGANKIFQLSNFHPVGLMIYASADLMRVPWEIVIKTFRAELGDKRFNTIEEYATSFFEFIAGNHLMFPDEIRKDEFLSSVRSAVYRILFYVRDDPRFDKTDTPNAQDNGELLIEMVASKKAETEKEPYPECLQVETVKEIKAKWAEEIEGILRGVFIEPTFGNSLDFKELADFFIEETTKHPSKYGSETGLVFCGFGDHDIFPKTIEYKLCGVIDGCTISFEESRTDVDYETPGAIKAFAQTSMADTFIVGMSLDIFHLVMGSVHSELETLTQSVLDTVDDETVSPQAIDEIIKKARDSIADAVLESSRKEHAYPLIRVIASLPIEEMSELAETLINLQSLKEKVTRPTETVGGPIDVAVITKSEGLVWIKRKLYFPPELNSRYTERQKSIYG